MSWAPRKPADAGLCFAAVAACYGNEPFGTAPVARPVTAVYNHITSTRLRR